MTCDLSDGRDLSPVVFIFSSGGVLEQRPGDVLLLTGVYGADGFPVLSPAVGV